MGASASEIAMSAGVHGVDFRPMANTTVIATAVVYGFLLRLAIAAGMFGFLLWFMIMLSLWRYGYAVLRHVASGWKRFPPPEIESTNPVGEFAVVLHSALFALSLFFFATTPFVHGPARWLGLAAVLAVAPASVAIMAMTRSAAAALNPFALASLVRDVGSDYLTLLAVSVGLGALLVVAGAMAEASWFLGMLGDMLAVWVVLALFLATGSVLRAHRFELELVAALDDAEERDEREQRANWQKTLDRAYASVRSGLPAQAYRTVKELIASERDSLEVYQWTFNGMLAWDEPHHAAMLGERFARKLWEAGRKVDALELAERCRRLSPQFIPPAAFTAELAEYARSIGRHRAADDLAALAATHAAARAPQA
jgi:hypothetical protein